MNRDDSKGPDKMVGGYLASLFGSLVWVGLVLLVALGTLNRAG